MKKRRILSTIWMLLLVLCCFPVSAAGKSSIRITSAPKTLTAGKTYTLKAEVKGKSKKAVWKTSDASVASISKNGKLTAKKAGKVVISAKANGKTAKCTITVKAKKSYARKGIYQKRYTSSYAGSMKASMSLIVLKTSGGKVKFVVEYLGFNGSPIYQTNTITVKLNGSKTAKFKWKDCWGNSGTGRLTFSAKKVTVKMNVTEAADFNRWMWGKSTALSYQANKKLTASQIEYYSEITY